MNNMNFRLQAGCQHCGNCSCRSQKPNNTVPGCNSHSQNQSNMASGCNSCSSNQNNMASGCNSCSSNQNNMASGCNNHHQNQPRTCDSGCERPHYRPPENCADSISHIDMHNIPIGIGYVPWQKWRNVYALCEGLSQGTIFKELDYPFYGCIPNGLCSQKGGAR